MLKNLPTTPETLLDWSWTEIEPYYQELESRSLTASNVDAWLADWSSVGERIEELYARLSVGTSVNTADKQAEERMNKFLDGIFRNVMAAEQKLKAETARQPARTERVSRSRCATCAPRRTSSGRTTCPCCPNNKNSPSLLTKSTAPKRSIGRARKSP